MLADSQGRTFRIVARPATGVKRLGVSPSGLSVILSPVKRDIEVDPSTTVQNYPSRSMPANSPNTTSSQSSNQSQSGEPLSRTNLYIRGLNPNTTDKDLVNLCNGFGKITSTKAIIDQTTNKCKGYGFVDFENPQAAELAVQALQNQGIQAQMAKNLHGFFQQQQEQDPTNLYIANLPMYFMEKNLENMFKEYGTVISTRILRKPDGQSRGVGFARMESKEKCDQIINAFNNKMLPGSTEPLLVKFADSGNKKKTTPTTLTPRLFTPGRDDAGISALQFAYEQQALAANLNGQFINYGVPTPTIMQAGLVPRGYTSVAATTPVTTYQMSSNPAATGWMPQYLVQPHQMQHMVTSSSHPGSGSTLDPSSVIPQLTTQMGQLQLSATSYLPTHYTQMYQASPQGTIFQPMGVPLDQEHTLIDDRTHHHFAYTSVPK
ncbi:RNA-binding motif, single-stranded-interacting protein 1-like isoform X7 [Biomphalaria glabrata]|uniref:RNA-binding motif, single-stranded-interacting protein 1-like isoform X7 n=1 Tax=Biomphalaria glabrata TaxID=6526 RepID=A0A9W2Y9Z2_BIOGL|nr:RNA-binding motif, single-stranded-interacting protein 1-like isoform X7 [Biomphalaria glabrata]XP_055859509.1 RNA-binding motif, single-stranded-interacting protein 1-like isoform X7 [Biomphalaria glabrata]XP_055859520.1 RNA-binding motif, single-stranded-interacting protein 1-like isoform X7 [Biomphalaria glabrata]XP_055859531.1 RNA-binding motif, single-stranded-interacting protein 1-like isoform X7 [Biomphalaria glabrata]